MLDTTDDSLSNDSLSDCLVIDEDRDDEAVVYSGDVKRGKKKLVLDSDDDDDDQIESNNYLHSKHSTESQNSDKENDILPPVTDEQLSGKIRRKIRVFSDNESDDDVKQTETKTPQQKSPCKFDVLKQKKSWLNDEEPEITENADMIKTFQSNSDLYDAENSSSDEEHRSEESSDEELSLNEIKKKARKTYKNKSSESKPKKELSGRRKLKKADIQQLHSDSQKMLREGRINLPYHVPQKKSLQDFLNRRKCTPEVLKPKAQEIAKTLEKIQTLKQQENQTKLSQSDVLPSENSKLTISESNFVIENDNEKMKLVCKKVLDDICEQIDKCVEVTEVLDSNKASETQSELRAKVEALSADRRALLEKKLVGILPKLGGGHVSDVICLDGDDNGLEKSEVDQFINRFAVHRAVTQGSAKQPRQVELNILKQEQDSLGETILTEEKLKINLSGDENKNLAESTKVPGANRWQLFKNLKEKMAQKRAHTREKLSQELRIDNEEFENEQSEEEMSDVDHHLHNIETESDEESDDDLTDKPERSKNIFVDDEADEDCDDKNEDDDKNSSVEDENEDDDKNSSDEDDDLDNELKVDSNDKVNLQVKDESVHLFYENSQPTNSFLCEDKAKDQCGNDLNKSIELMGSIIRPNQPSRRNSFYQDTQQSSTSQMFETSQFDNLQSHPVPPLFKLDSQFISNSLKLDSRVCTNESNSAQENYDELVNLCSGKFTESKAPTVFGINNLCSTPTASLDNMNELANLCSGNFNLVSSSVIEANQEEETFNNESFVDHAEDDNISISSLTSDIGKRKKLKKKVVSDSEDETDSEDNQSQILDSDIDEEEDEEEEGMKSKSVRGMSKFVEDEAELSGSEADSDDDYDGTEKDDVLMEELGDMEQFSDDELKSQVEKVHMKLIHDEDQRRLRYMKELYLEDGDLHFDGHRRMRKFRWNNNTGDDVLDDRNDGNSDNELNDEDTDDLEMRRHRFERESWLTNESKLNKFHDEDSMFGNLLSGVQKLNRSLTIKPSEEIKINKQEKIRRGSFLSKNEKFLSKIADVTKATSDQPSGPNNSRNFVFGAKTPPNKKPQMRRPSTVPSSRLNPVVKRICLENSVSNCDSQDSIFNLL